MPEKNDLAKELVRHPFMPLAGPASRILILGTMPSAMSRQNNFYYAHPQNRFWPLLAQLYNETVPVTIEQKTRLILQQGIMLWDVLQECAIKGSSDASISQVVINPVDELLQRQPVQAIFANGQTAGRLYRQHLENKTKMPITVLPVTENL